MKSTKKNERNDNEKNINEADNNFKSDKKYPDSDRIIINLNKFLKKENKSGKIDKETISQMKKSNSLKENVKNKEKICMEIKDSFNYKYISDDLKIIISNR